jgi:3-hydroxyisobutyrate dehydrogenase-like beta-hydroxyacid dehydrogenase
MTRDVAFLCLGTMGYPMAGHLARCGYAVTVYNRTSARARQWVEVFGGRAAPSPAEAARGAGVVLASTANDDALREITLGPAGAFGAMGPGGIFVDHSTGLPAVARELAAEAERRGLSFVDAPVSGGQSGAEEGRLTVMAGGSAEAWATVEPLLAAYATKAALLGRSGSGQLAKAVNQICLAGLIQSLAEGLRFAERAGLDARRVVEVISRGAAQSWQMDHRAETMLAGRFDFGFAVDLMRKDLAIALAEAARNGAALPVAALVDRFWAEVQARGGGRWDTSSLITRLP